MKRLILFYINNSHFFFFSLLLLLVVVSHALPLSTNSRWIVDTDGRRVKLACLNWAAHVETSVAEGLSRLPVDVISIKVKEMGFNCVRLTWPLYLVTNHTLERLTVRESFRINGLSVFIPGIRANNPSILDRSLINAFEVVVTSLRKNKVMVILDNHVSKPGWCCNRHDGNGFFGDKYFNPKTWIQGLTNMAARFRHNRYVVGISLRNELHGSRQNVRDWYRYMQQAAEAVHKANRHLLVIVSGLAFDKYFTFIHKRAVRLSFTGKLVYETHWYAFSNQQNWREGNPNEVCGRITRQVNQMSGFLLKHGRGYPLFVSEWGVDLRGKDVNDNRYLNCFLAWAAEHDLDWALWTLEGSYYVKWKVIGMDEVYGVLNWDWTKIRNEGFMKQIAFLKSPLQGPGISKDDIYKLIYHPSTGLCVIHDELTKKIRLGNCLRHNYWTYTPQNTLTLRNSNLCLKAHGWGKSPLLTSNCTGRRNTRWTPFSDSKLQLSTVLRHGKIACLGVDYVHYRVVTTTCKCVRRNFMCSPENQWFKIINAPDYFNSIKTSSPLAN